MRPRRLLLAPLARLVLDREAPGECPPRESREAIRRSLWRSAKRTEGAYRRVVPLIGPRQEGER
jgi:hypothetical protein